MLLIDGEELKSPIDETLENEKNEERLQEEILFLQENHTYDLVNLPKVREY